MALWAAVQPPLSTNGGPHIRKLWLHYVYRTVCWWCFDIINVEFGITASSTTHLCPVYALNVGQLWWEALTLWLIMKQRFWYLAVREENCSVTLHHHWWVTYLWKMLLLLVMFKRCEDVFKLVLLTHKFWQLKGRQTEAHCEDTQSLCFWPQRSQSASLYSTVHINVSLFSQCYKIECFVDMLTKGVKVPK